MGYDAFISYRSTDLSLAESLKERLVGEGFRVWFDKARLKPGFDWHREIEEGCDASRVLLPVLTPDWKSSTWCLFETYGAEEVVPLLFSGEWPDVAPPPLRRFQYFDFRGPAPDWSPVVAAIRGILAQPAPQKQPRVASLPYSHNPYFVGRESLLLHLHERLHPAPTTTLTRGSVQVITGVGGVGKTTIAREYAEKYWRAYQDILWVWADPALLTTEFARLALELKAVRQPSKDAAEDARAALSVLNGPASRLLIFDNAPDEQSIQQWLPTVGGCRTIVTSRFAGWSPVVNATGVDSLDRESARDLLLRRSGLAAEPHGPAAERLADELAGLPLALEQAAAFMKKLALDFNQYLEIYKLRRLELLSERVLGGTQYPESVATTWRTTVAHLGEQARSLLQLMAHLAPDDIPIWLLERADTGSPSLLSRLASVVRALFGKRSDDDRGLRLRRALGELSEYSMIRLREDGVTVHRLVQTVQMDEQGERSRKAWAKRAVLAVSRAAPMPDFPNFDRWGHLLPHARLAAEAVSRWDFRFAGAPLLINQTAIYLQKRGQYAAAEAGFRQATAIWGGSLLLGRYHPQYSVGRGNLGILLNVQGRFSDAEPVLLEALSLRPKFLRSMDTQAANLLTALAILQISRADHAGAEERFREARDIQRRTVGERSPLYGEALSNLATVLMDSGRYDQAEPLIREALEVVRRAFSEDHPSVSQMAQNLAVAYYKQKKYAQAEPLYQAALKQRTAALGEDHPELAYIQTNLAKMYLDQGRHGEAEPLLRRALKIRDSASGAPHPEIARTLSYLGAVLDATGRGPEAASLHGRALQIVEGGLGDRHPLLATVLDNYAASLRLRGRDLEAAPMEARAREIRGPASPKKP